MKKIKYTILLVLIALSITGCFGMKSDGVLTATCERTEVGYTMEEKTTYQITYKEGDITNISLSKSYVVEDGNLTNSLISYQYAYEKSDGVRISVDNETNTITYNFDMTKLASDAIKKTFNLKTTYNEQIKTLKDIGFTCE